MNTKSLRQRNTGSGNKRFGPAPVLYATIWGERATVFLDCEAARSYVTGLYPQLKNITINYYKSQAAYICHIDRQSILLSFLAQNRPTSCLSLTVVILTTVRMIQPFAKGTFVQEKVVQCNG